jgi:hypothetical protein
MRNTKEMINDFYEILALLREHEPFAFNRFSDGELYILQNKKLVLNNNVTQVGNIIHKHTYTKEDHKSFDPLQKEDMFARDRLIDAFRFSKKNYFKGISCKCCCGIDDWKWQFTLIDPDEPNLTWANLLVNGNYKRFITEMYPLFNEYPTVFICHETANLSMMPFVTKDFHVGYNAMINDYHKIDEIKKWINDNGIKGYLFLFSASTFSKFAIHQFYEFCDKNTYIDIGTTLNAFMGMKVDRGYLQEYWLGVPGHYLNLNCIW